MHSQATIRVSDFPVSLTDALPRRRTRVVIVGNPNSGKTTIFNKLTGSKARVGNYPGITVEQRSGAVTLPHGETIELIDAPGTYSLCAQSPEEQVTVDLILPFRGTAPDLIVTVIDATALERSLYLTVQLLDAGIPVVVVMNMMDEMKARGVALDIQKLGDTLGAPVIATIARKNEGLEELREAIERTLRIPFSEKKIVLTERGPHEEALEHLTQLVGDINPQLGPKSCRLRAHWSLISLGEDDLEGIPANLRESVAQIREQAAQSNQDIDQDMIAKAYERVRHAMKGCLEKPPEPPPSLSQRLDHILVHPLWGTLCFTLVMIGLFEVLFTGSEPLMRAIEQTVAHVRVWVHTTLPEGPLNDLVSHGLVAGAGNVLVFVPQIAFLCAFLAFIEDSGYLARVAFLIDRLMRSVGLHGRAFIPLLSGFACAIPAIIATRTIENRKDRLITMLALPLMSCSARLPVFALIIATLFSGQRVAGILSTGTLILAGLYCVSLLATLTAAWLLRRTVLRGPLPTFILELPPYRWPTWRNVANVISERLRAFLMDAGMIIVAFTVILWGLLSFPKDNSVHLHFESLRERTASQESQASIRQSKLTELDAREASEQVAHSVAGRVGKALEPALSPLGFDWRIAIGLIGSFAAREVFVSTMGVVYGVADQDDIATPLRTTLRQARRPDGRRQFTPLVGFSLMIFFLFACQCMSTLAVIRRESGSWKWPLLMFTYMTVLAYVASLTIYQVGTYLGLGS